jgi:hypothetical protein
VGTACLCSLNDPLLGEGDALLEKLAVHWSADAHHQGTAIVRSIERGCTTVPVAPRVMVLVRTLRGQCLVAVHGLPVEGLKAMRFGSDFTTALMRIVYLLCIERSPRVSRLDTILLDILRTRFFICMAWCVSST